jgi:hypothetical protein
MRPKDCKPAPPIDGLASTRRASAPASRTRNVFMLKQARQNLKLVPSEYFVGCAACLCRATASVAFRSCKFLSQKSFKLYSEPRLAWRCAAGSSHPSLARPPPPLASRPSGGPQRRRSRARAHASALISGAACLGYTIQQQQTTSDRRRTVCSRRRPSLFTGANRINKALASRHHRRRVCYLMKSCGVDSPP